MELSQPVEPIQIGQPSRLRGAWVYMSIALNHWALSFRGGSDGKEPTGNVGDSDSIPVPGRSPGEENGESHGQSHLAGYIPCGHKESDMAEQQTLHFSSFHFPSLNFGVVFNAAQLQQSLESPWDLKIQPVHPKGTQPWIFTGRAAAEARAPIHWPPDTKSLLIGKDSDAEKDGGQEEKGQQRMRRLGGITNSREMSLRNPRRWCRTGKPGMLQSIGLQRVRHNWATEQNLIHWPREAQSLWNSSTMRLKNSSGAQLLHCPFWCSVELALVPNPLERGLCCLLSQSMDCLLFNEGCKSNDYIFGNKVRPTEICWIMWR